MLLSFNSFLCQENKEDSVLTERDYYNDLREYKKANNGKEKNCILCIQEEAAQFFKYSLMISEPSTVSSFSNWKKNYNGFQKKNYVIDWRTKTPYGLGKYFRISKLFFHLHIEPSINVRIFRNEVTDQFGDSSLPVRTPSYIPGASIYFSHIKFWRSETQNKNWNFYGHFKAYHHSDGQDGAHFDSLGLVNRYNGDFGEQIVYQYGLGAINRKKSLFWYNTAIGIGNTVKGLGNLFRKNDKKIAKIKKLDKLSITRGDGFNTINYYKLDIENSPVKLFGKIRNTSEAWYQYGIYGRTRLLFQFGHIFHPTYTRHITFQKKKYKIGNPYEKEMFRIVGNVDYVLNSNYSVGSIYSLESVPFFDHHRLNVDLSFYYRIPWSETLGVFAQGAFVNNDRYNVYFQDRYLEFRIGIAYGWFNFGL